MPVKCQWVVGMFWMMPIWDKEDRAGDIICVVYVIVSPPLLLTHSCLRHGVWLGGPVLQCGHNSRNVCRAQTVMGPSLSPCLSSSSDINCNFAVLNYTTERSSQYVSIPPHRPSLTVSFLQSHNLRRVYSIQRCLDLCIYYLIMVVVKDIGIHYYSAYSLCGGTNLKLYTHRLRLNNYN